jgi:L-lactate dehydrogenase complex protein LldG
MSTRDEILERVRRNQPPAIALPALPSFAAGPGPLLERFKAGVLRMGGKVADPPADGDLAALVARLFPDAKVVCSATPEVPGNRPLAAVRSPADLHDVDVGVVRAVFGVAETGSVWITGMQFKVNSWAFSRSISSCCSIRRASSAISTTLTATCHSLTQATASS